MPWPSPAVTSGPRRLSPPPRITARYRNSQPTCSTAFCSSPADRPDLQSQAQSAFEKVRPGLLIGIRTGPFRTLLLVGRDVGDHALLEGDLLDLTRHLAQVYQHPIDFNHPHERVLIQQAGQRPLGIKSARVQSLRDDARLRTGCALADPEPGTQISRGHKGLC